MNNRLLALYGQMLAANARVEGMVADNQAWVAQGQSPSYGEEHFSSEALHLEELANQAREEETAITVAVKAPPGTTGTVVEGPNGNKTMLLATKEEQSVGKSTPLGGFLDRPNVEFRLGEQPL